jgi:hypothetical protein
VKGNYQTNEDNRSYAGEDGRQGICRIRSNYVTRKFVEPQNQNRTGDPMISKKTISVSILGLIILIFCVIFVVWTGKMPKKPTDITPGDYSDSIEYAEQIIQRAMKRYHLPSVAVSLIDDQETIWQETFGLANLEENTPSELETVYKLWSVAKVFTAIETMRLVKDGLVDLDAPITEYLPNFSIQSRFPDSDPITIRSILTHRSGLPRNECHWNSVFLKGFPNDSIKRFYQQTAIYGTIKTKPPHMGVSERGAARTLNQWLKRTIEKNTFSHPMSCCFYPIFWTTRESSTLDEFIKVLSTL